MSADVCALFSQRAAAAELRFTCIFVAAASRKPAFPWGCGMVPLRVGFHVHLFCCLLRPQQAFPWGCGLVPLPDGVQVRFLLTL